MRKLKNDSQSSQNFCGNCHFDGNFVGNAPYNYDVDQTICGDNVNAPINNGDWEKTNDTCATDISQ